MTVWSAKAKPSAMRTNPITKTAIDITIAPPASWAATPATSTASRMPSCMARIWMGRNGRPVWFFSGVEIAAVGSARQAQRGQSICRLLGGGQSHRGAGLRLAVLRQRRDHRGEERRRRRGPRATSTSRLHEAHRSRSVLVRAAGPRRRAYHGRRQLRAYPVVEARKDGRTISRLDDVDWLEEPLRAAGGSSKASPACAGRGTPIAAGENDAEMFGFKRADRCRGHRSSQQPSVLETRRHRRWRDGHPISASRVVSQVRPHSAYLRPRPHRHPFMRRPRCCAIRSIEVFWADLEASPFDPWIHPVNAMMKGAAGPGLGVDPDLKVIENYRVATTVTKKAK